MGSEKITIQLTPNDVAETRFAFSPILEVIKSFQVLYVGKRNSRFRLWTDETQRTLFNVEFPYLQALTASKIYIPDFLTPTPLTSGLTIEDEIAVVLSTPDDLVRKNILTLIEFHGDSELLRQFLVYPCEMLYCLGEELRLYWRLALMHHWSRMRNVLEEDILYRARNLALHGYGKLIEDISSLLSYNTNAIYIANASDNRPTSLDLRGGGLQFVPALFSNVSLMWQIVPEWHPMLVYIPRGTGLWWRELPSTPEQSLEIALGAGRARVLQGLATPASTGELARRLNLTDGAVSQHLNRLRQAGLVESQRSAKNVYYSLTSRGANLLQLFDGKYESN